MGKRMGALPAAMLIAVLSIIPSSARTPRPIIIDGTVKAANGDLLRGTTLHVSKTYSARARDYGLSYSNMRILRDQCHVNLIRLGLNDPFEVFDGDTAAAFDSIEQTYYWADSIIKVCDSLGIYVQLNYHAPGFNWTPAGQPWGEWDVRNFWAHYAPRYKDKPFVMYQLFNEGVPYSRAPDTAYTRKMFGEVYRIVRAAAPDNIVYHIDCVYIQFDWGPYLLNSYAPILGFNWNSGKDLFSFHTYVASTLQAIQQTRRWGIPFAPPEFTAVETQSCCPPPFLEKCHYPSEWYERNGMSWTLWYPWNDPDQARGFRDFIDPDATKKGYAWWNIRPPSTPANVSARALDSYNVALTWDKPVDTGNGILGYRVYRNGIDIAFPYWPKGTAFTDTGLHAATTYSYQIAARTFGGVLSAKSPAIQVNTPVDNAPPIPVLVSGAGDGLRVHVLFAEPVDRTSAQTVANYVINPADAGITIGAASLAPDQKTLTLTTSKMTRGTDYALTMSNIADRAAVPNIIPPNTAFPFKYVDGITRIRIFPCVGGASRLACGVFEGTNGSKDTGPYTAFYTFPYVPPPAIDSWKEITEAKWMEQTGYANFDIGYRYVRYSQFDEGQENAGGHTDVAEIEFYYGDVKAAGAPFGAPVSDTSNSYAKAFDGNTKTFYHYPTTTGGYTGLDLGDKGVMNAARVPPRLGCKSPDLRIAARQGILEARIKGVHSSQIVNVAIYGLQGKLVRRFAGRADAAGTALVRADNRVPAGNYLAQISAGTLKWTLPVMVE